VSFPAEFSIGMRHLRSRRKAPPVSLKTLLAVLGFALIAGGSIAGFRGHGSIPFFVLVPILAAAALIAWRRGSLKGPFSPVGFLLGAATLLVSLNTIPIVLGSITLVVWLRVSLRTVLSVLGIALGVTALIDVVGVMTGFERELRTKILGTQSHVLVTETGASSMAQWSRVLAAVKKAPEVVAASPFVYGQAMLSANGNVTGAVVRGVKPAQEIDVTDIDKNMRTGSLARLGETGGPLPGVVIGAVLASSLGVRSGEKVTLISPVPAVTPMGLLPRSKSFRIVGIFRSGFYQYDSGLAFIEMGQAQKFFGLGKGVTGVHLKVEDIFRAERVARGLQKSLPFPYWVRSWQVMNRNLFSALKTEKTTMTIILFLLVIIAAFNIIGSLVMVVMEKGREIAILKSMGATWEIILRIFLIQGAAMGLAGSVLGTLGGLVLGWNLHHVEDFLEKYLGLDILPASIYHIDRLPVFMTVSDVTTMAVGAFIISLIATIYPAWRASRIDPVEVLRYG